MATIAQNPTSSVIGQKSVGKSGSVTTGSCVVDDPTLTPSQRRKRPLSIIKESDTDSDASSDMLAGKGNNSSSSGQNSPRRSSSLRLGSQSGISSTAPGKVTSPRRIMSSSSARCSPTIRKLTENFERSPTSSPSRASARLMPRPSTPTSTALRNGRTSSNNSNNSNSSNNNNSSSNIRCITSSSNNTNGNPTSSKTNSPRTIANKTGPTQTTKNARPSSFPAARVVTSSTSGRTSSPSQASKPGSRTGARTPLSPTDTANKQITGRGMSAAGSKVDRKTPGSPTKQPAKPWIKNSKICPKPEKTPTVPGTRKSSGGEKQHREASQNVENEIVEKDEIDLQGAETDKVKEEVEATVTNNCETESHDTPPATPPLKRLGSLTPGSDMIPIPRDGGGLARIRETAERLKLTSPSSPLSSSPSPTQSPKFSHRVRLGALPSSPPLMLMAPGSPPVTRGSTGQVTPSAVPQITITHSDGTFRGPPPQLGPSVSASIIPHTPCPPHSALLSAIAETDSLNSSPSESNDDRDNNNIGSSNVDNVVKLSGPTGPVANINRGTSNNNIRSLLPYTNFTANLNYHNNLNTADRTSNSNFPRTPFMHGSRSPTSTQPQTSTALQPHYKLFNSAFFARRLSSGGTSICEEAEEEEDTQTDTKASDKDSERAAGSATAFSSSSCSSALLLSERGSSVSSLGSTTSINSTEPTSPPLPQPQLANTCVQQISASHLCQLKETADKLRLSTRRDSTMAWRQKYLDSPGHMRSVSVANGGISGLDDGRLTQDRKQRIDAALDWLREELVRAVDLNAFITSI